MTHPTRLDPRTAWLLDARHLLDLLPHVDSGDLHTIRGEFARVIQASRTPYPTWQDAWNAWTEATPTSPGRITYTTPRCPQCKGRRFETRHISRNLSRTGQPYVCGECRGTGRGSRTTQPARYATPPTQETP